LGDPNSYETRKPGSQDASVSRKTDQEHKHRNSSLCRLAFTGVGKPGTIPLTHTQSDYAEQNDVERSNDSPRNTLCGKSAFGIRPHRDFPGPTGNHV